MLFPSTRIGGSLHYEYLGRHDTIYSFENVTKLQKRIVYSFFPQTMFNKNSAWYDKSSLKTKTKTKLEYAKIISNV